MNLHNFTIEGVEYTNVCSLCRSRNREGGAKRQGAPPLMSAANRMDPGRIDYGLDDPTIVEEMLMARVHIQVECFQIRGQQWSYRGHMVSFLKDVIQVYNKLPLMPADLNIVVLKPADADDTDTADRNGRQLQFSREFTVRKDVVLAWLRFLKANHPGYRDVSIDYQVDLPQNANVMDQVTNSQYRDAGPSKDGLGNQRPRTQPEGNPANSAETDANADTDDGFDSGAVPALDVDRNMDDLRRQVGARPLGRQQPQQRPALTWPDVEERPLSEWIESQAILLLAFLSLYLRGLAEINQPRDRYVTYRDHVLHLLKYKDGRFASHPRWRYVVFNTEMRIQTKNSLRFFVKLNLQYQSTILEDIRAAFEAPNNPKARRLLNAITRSASVLRGTPAYCAGIKRNLEAYCRFLGTPDFFFTFSTANL